MNKTKRYLGDGVYASRDEYDLILTTEDGITVRNRIVMEPEVLRNLFEYLQLDVKTRPSAFTQEDL